MHFYKKKALALAAMLGLIAGVAQAETTWVMPTGYPDTSYFTANVRAFADEVAKATNGTLLIDVRSNGSLIKLDTIKRAVQSGQVPIGEIRLGIYGNEDQMNVLEGVPNLASTYDQAWKLMEAQASYFDKTYGAKGLKILGYTPWPGQGFFTKEAVKSSDDFKGVKIRIYSKTTDEMAQKLGFNATILPFAEVPQAFSTGMIDALFTSAQTGCDIQAWDYVQYFTFTGTMFNKNAIVVNKRAFDKLTPEEQAAVVAAGENATKRAWQLSKEFSEKTEQELIDHGMSVAQASSELQTRMNEVGAEMLEDWKATANSDQLAVLEAYQASVK
jgi:TRAP-type C4-dicarboxylate transport system substrate-binding protein